MIRTHLSTSLVFQRGFLLLSASLLTISCTGNSRDENRNGEHNQQSDRLIWFSPCQVGSELRFQTGFDSAMALSPAKSGQALGFEGKSGMKSCEASHLQKKLTGINLGRAEIQFEGGDDDERWARVVSDPENPLNRVLSFMLKKPNVRDEKRHPPKGRVQMNVYKNAGVNKLKMSVRMYLNSDFHLVSSFSGKMDWLTISEWWNNAGWTDESYPFRITVNLIKKNEGGNSPLVFNIHGQMRDTHTQRWSTTVWEETGNTFSVPVGRWITLDYEFEEGNASTGRFFMAATVDGGKRITIFDIHNFTHHPSDPNPDGLRDFNPIKLYTSGKLVNFVRSKGGGLQIYWDDLEIQATSK